MLRHSVPRAVGLVDREEIQTFPERCPDLSPLALSVAERLPPGRPIGLEPQFPAQAAGLRIARVEKGAQPGRRRVRPLMAQDRALGDADRSRVRQEFAADEPQESGLAGAVGADDTSPAGRELHREIAPERLDRPRMRESDVSQVCLNGGPVLWPVGHDAPSPTAPISLRLGCGLTPAPLDIRRRHDSSELRRSRAARPQAPLPSGPRASTLPAMIREPHRSGFGPKREILGRTLPRAARRRVAP